MLRSPHTAQQRAQNYYRLLVIFTDLHAFYAFDRGKLASSLIQLFLFSPMINPLAPFCRVSTVNLTMLADVFPIGISRQSLRQTDSIPKILLVPVYTENKIKRQNNIQ